MGLHCIWTICLVSFYLQMNLLNYLPERRRVISLYWKVSCHYRTVFFFLHHFPLSFFLPNFYLTLFCFLFEILNKHAVLLNTWCQVNQTQLAFSEKIILFIEKLQTKYICANNEFALSLRYTSRELALRLTVGAKHVCMCACVSVSVYASVRT